MEVAPDLMASLRSRVSPAGKAAEMPRLDWGGLHARLCAAHAARQVLAADDSRRIAAGGGFGQWATSAQPAANPSQRVNLNDSTDGKALSGIAVEIAEQPTDGD